MLIVFGNSCLLFSGKTWGGVLTQELNAMRKPPVQRAYQLGPWEHIPDDLSDFTGYEPHETSPVIAQVLKEYWGIEFPVTLRRKKPPYKGNRGRGDIMTALSATVIGNLDQGCRVVFSGYFLTTQGVPECCVQDYELGWGCDGLEKRTLANTWVDVELKDSWDTYEGCPAMNARAYKEMFP